MTEHDIHLKDEKEKGKTMLVFLKGKIKAKYSLPGEVSVERGDTGELLTDDHAHLGDIIKPNSKTLVFRYDANVSVAGGGWAEGGVATGPFAQAGGAFGAGGEINEDGAQGGDSQGGFGRGEKAKGGAAQGGPANLHEGGDRTAEGGESLGGVGYDTTTSKTPDERKEGKKHHS